MKFNLKVNAHNLRCVQIYHYGENKNNIVLSVSRFFRKRILTLAKNIKDETNLATLFIN